MANRCLGGGIARNGEPALKAEHGAEKDDLAVPARHHPRTEVPGELKRGGEIDGEHVVPVCVGVIAKRGAADDAGVVHQNVDLLTGCIEARDEIRDSALFPEIRAVVAEASSVRAHGLARFAAILGKTGADPDDIRSGSRECHGNGAPDPPAAPGDKRRVSRKVEGRGRVRHDQLAPARRLASTSRRGSPRRAA